jgi:hypothetical protein
VKGIAWLQALRAYLASSLSLHLVWEVAQLPLYTIWTTGTFRKKLFTAIHCALGDVVIAGVALLGGLVVAGSSAWPWQRWWTVFATTVAAEVGYTINSEWLNVAVRQSWAYSPYARTTLHGHRTGSPLTMDRRAANRPCAHAISQPISRPQCSRWADAPSPQSATPARVYADPFRTPSQRRSR